MANEGEPGVTRDACIERVGGRISPWLIPGSISGGGEIIEGVRQRWNLPSRVGCSSFVVDARSGLNPDDLEIALMIRKANKPVVLVANKVERFDQLPWLMIFTKGLGDPVPVSAAEV